MKNFTGLLFASMSLIAMGCATVERELADQAKSPAETVSVLMQT
ncbi:hypothetical protein ACFL02_04730 [Planctomycetota bacterium]